MKTILILFISFITLSLSAQTPKYAEIGAPTTFGGTTADSLLAADTVTYIFETKSTVGLGVVFQIGYTEVSGTQTVTFNVFGSNDKTLANKTAIKKGKASGSWTSGSKTASEVIYLDSEQDTAYIQRKYIIIQGISSGASSKGKVSGVAYFRQK